MAQNVTIPPLPEPISYDVTSAQSEFAIPFPFFDGADIIVRVDGERLTPGSDYTVAGYFLQNGDPVEGHYGSGLVTLNAPVSDCTVEVDRFVDPQRATVFSNVGPLPVRAVNTELNKSVARDQDLKRQMDEVVADATGAALDVLATKADKTTTDALDGRIGAIEGDYTTAAAAAAAAPVQSVAGKTGAVALDKADVGLGDVDNTADPDKPISTAQQAALDLKANAATTISAAGLASGGGSLAANRTITVSEASQSAAQTGTASTGAMTPRRTTDHFNARVDSSLRSALKDSASTGAFLTAIGAGTTGASLFAAEDAATAKAALSLVKADVGLGNVDNTADPDKPVSTAQQAALDLKAPLASPALTGNPTAPTQDVGNNSTRIATTAFVKGERDALLEASDFIAAVDARVSEVGIPDGGVTNAKLDDMAQATIKGRASGAGTGAPVDLTASQAATILRGQLIDSAITNGETNKAPTSDAVYDALGGKLSTDAGAVGASNLATGAVTEDKIGSGAVTEAKLASDAVTNAKLANMAQATLKGRASGAGTGDPADLTAAQAATIVRSELLSDAIADSETSKAPTQNAVFDALSLRDVADRSIRAAMFPPRPDATASAFTWSFEGSPEAAPSINPSQIADVVGYGYVLKAPSATNAASPTFVTRSAVPATLGRIYEVSVEFELVSADPGATATPIISAASLKADYAFTDGPPYAGNTTIGDPLAVGEIRTATRRFAGQATTGATTWSAPSSAVWLRFLARCNRSGGASEWRIRSFAVNDVTDIVALEAGKQPLDATLTALAGVTTAADKLIYATGSDTFATTDLTAAGRTILANDGTTYGGYYTDGDEVGDDLNAPALLNWPDRANIGAATLATGIGTVHDYGHPWFPVPSEDGPRWLGRSSTVAVMDSRGQFAVSGLARTADAAGLSGQFSTAGVGGWSETSANNTTSRAGYFEAQIKSGVTGGMIYGLEVITKNLSTEDKKSNPYGGGTNSVGVHISSCADPSYGPGKAPSSAAIVVGQGGEPTGSPATLARASNTVTCAFASAVHFRAGDSVVLSGAGNASFNGTFTILTASTDFKSFTWAQTASDASSSGGTVALASSAPYRFNRGLVFGARSLIGADGTGVSGQRDGRAITMASGHSISWLTPATSGESEVLGALLRSQTTGTGNDTGIIFSNGQIGFVGASETALLDLVHSASAVNRLQIGNAATGAPLTLTAAGSDTNIDIRLAPKADGNVAVSTRVVVGATSAISWTGLNQVSIVGAGNAGFAIQSGASSLGRLSFGDSAYAGGVEYDHATDRISLAAAGSPRLKVEAGGVGFNGVDPVARPSITGSRGGNAALESLLDALDSMGLITDTTI